MKNLHCLQNYFLTAVLFLCAACSNARNEMQPPASDRSEDAVVSALPADTDSSSTPVSSATSIPPTNTAFPAFTSTAAPTLTLLPASPTAIPDTPAAINTPTPTDTPEPSGIDWRQAAKYQGQEVTICGPVVGTHYASGSNGRPTFLNIGEDYPSPNRFTVLIWGYNRDNFSQKPEEIYAGLTICVHGRVEIYEGVAEIEAEQPGQISISGSG